MIGGVMKRTFILLLLLLLLLALLVLLVLLVLHGICRCCCSLLHAAVPPLT
jgi:hypothetical protein